MFNERREKINWQALSVMLAMFTFIAQILWSMYADYDKKQNDKLKLRTMFAYEIKSNSKPLCFVYATRHINSRPKGYEFDEDVPIDLYGIGRVRLSMLSNFEDKVYSNYFTQIQILDADEIAFLMNYYKKLDDLKIQIGRSSSFMSKRHSAEEIDSENYMISTTFKDQLLLTRELIHRYSDLIPKVDVNDGSCDENNSQ